MKVDWIIPCKFVEVVEGLATIVGAGADTHHVPGFPAVITVPMALRMTSPPGSGAGDHVLTAQVLTPSMDPASPQLEAGFHSEPNPGMVGDAEGQVILSFGTRFQATEPGLYTVVVAVDGRSEQICIRVIEQAQP